MTNRNRAWRRRQRNKMVKKFRSTHSWVSDQVEKTKTVVQSASGRLRARAKRKVDQHAQGLREAWTFRQDVREAWE